MALKIKTLAGLVNAALHIKTASGIVVPVNLHAKTADGIALLSGSLVPFRLSSLAVIGDSITEGAAATAEGNRWVNIVSQAIGAGSPLNQGMSGTVLQNSAGASGTPLGNNGRDRFVSALLGGNKRDGVFVNYGFNDARYTAAPETFNVAGYSADLSQVVAGLIEGGYDRNKILLTTPYYITDSGLNTGSSGFTGQTRAGFTEFVDAVKDVATEYGVWCYDAYTYMLENGAGTLISVDNIHPGDIGHAAIAAGMLATTAKLNPLQAVVATVGRATSTTANYSITAPVGSVTSYTIEYSIDGSFDYGNAVTVTDLTGTVAVPSDDCRVRIRANFSDGSKSPWSISDKIADVSTFVLDTFTDADGTLIGEHSPEIGGAWVAQSGYAPVPHSAIAANRLYSQSAAGTYINAAEPSSPDYYVEVVIDFLTSISGNAVGVIARADSSSNNFYFARYSKASNNFRMFKQVNGTPTQLGTAVSATFTSGSYTLRLQVQGSTVSMYVNGSLGTSVEDATFAAAGHAGVMDVATQTATTGRHIASFKAALI